jgi:hypothetical protein
VSVVQAFASLQSAFVPQVAQPEMAACWQTPPTQESAVQMLLSLQSAAIAHVAQPGMNE